MTPLVRDDDEYGEEQEEKPRDPLEQVPQQVKEKTVGFKDLLAGAGRWLANRKLPDPVKQGLRDQWNEVWTGDKHSRTTKKKKYLAGPFKTFNKEKKKGKL